MVIDVPSPIYRYTDLLIHRYSIHQSTDLHTFAEDTKSTPLKNFLDNPDAIKDIVVGFGACIATNRIVKDGQAVGFMYRERPEFEGDSGWRFLAGDEDDAYMDNHLNSKVYDVNTIANYDEAVVPYLKLSYGIELERIEGTDEFQQINN